MIAQGGGAGKQALFGLYTNPVCYRLSLPGVAFDIEERDL